MSCFIENCCSKRRRNPKKEEPNVAFFRATSDETLSAWQNAIPNGESLRKNNFICELHFQKEEVIKEFVQALPNNQIWTCPRKVALLKKGSVPSIFPVKGDSMFLQKKSPIKCYVENASENFDLNKIPCTGIDNDSSLINNVQPHLEKSSNDDKNAIKISKRAQFLKIRNSVTENSQSTPLSKNWITQVISTGTKCIMWIFWKYNYSGIAKRIVLFPDMMINIYIEETLVELEGFDKVESIDDIRELITHLSENVFACQKIDGTEKADNCVGYIIKDNSNSSHDQKIMRCIHCKAMRVNLHKRMKESANINRIKEKHKMLKLQLRSIYRKSNRLNEKIKRLKETVKCIKSKCAKTDSEVLQKACEKLPENQQLAVQACFNASKVKKNGIRYTNEWIYECLVLRNESRETYNHLRKQNILCLPSCQTLNRYLQFM